MTKLLLLADVAERLHCSPWTLRRHVYSGRLACVRIGKRMQFTEQDIETFIVAMRRDSSKRVRNGHPALMPDVAQMNERSRKWVDRHKYDYKWISRKDGVAI